MREFAASSNNKRSENVMKKISLAPRSNTYLERRELVSGDMPLTSERELGKVVSFAKCELRSRGVARDAYWIISNGSRRFGHIQPLEVPDRTGAQVIKWRT